jgi:hypothetical protein
MINDECGYGVILYPDQFNDFKALIRALKCGSYMKAAWIVRIINERLGK